ncbi:cytochrome c biogenesis protein CcdA [Candidatus Uhrbacteria bacterium]|nr:cytochrome c biogenesis protein CcdA [Candidatus Uhrbacteria bacterium]
MLQFLFALLAGAVTVAGPCILPLLPIILGTSTVKQHPSRPLFIILGFILSFSFFAILLGVFGARLGIDPEIFRTVAAIMIGFFGFTMLFPKIQESLFAKLQPLLQKLTPRTDPGRADLSSGFVLGASLGLVWTPCAGPVLGSILTLVAAKQNLAQAGALLFAYALGAGIPMLGIAYGGQAATSRVRAITKHSATIQRGFGAVIILVAIGLLTGADRTVQTWLIQNVPWLFLNLNVNL